MSTVEPIQLDIEVSSQNPEHLTRLGEELELQLGEEVQTEVKSAAASGPQMRGTGDLLVPMLTTFFDVIGPLTNLMTVTSTLICAFRAVRQKYPNLSFRLTNPRTGVQGSLEATDSDKKMQEKLLALVKVDT